MPETRIERTTTTDLTNQVSDFEVDPAFTDGTSDQKETTWQMQDWSTYLGYYKAIPELTATIDAKAQWTVGKGFKADEVTTMLLDTFKGWGNDTFNVIMENMMRTYLIGGDAFAEIIRDDEDNLINIKPLDPSSIVVVVNRKGMIKRYEQTEKILKGKNKRFQPDQIFHISRNRVADEIHGISLVEKLETIILMRNEAMADYKKLLHRNVAPIHKWTIDTDDITKRNTFKAEAEKVIANMEHFVIPKGSVEHELVSVPSNATLNPLPWIENLNKYFYQAAQIPQFIVGGGTGFTEASEKIAFIAFGHVIEADQMYLEEQILSQLNLVVEFARVASIQQELISDTEKDGNVNIDQSELNAGSDNV